MSSLHLHHTHVLLDTCCVINLHATGRMDEILATLPATMVIAEDVRLEIKLFDIQAYVDRGVIVLDDFTGEEYNLSVRIAADIYLENGEIAVGAIAMSRSWAIATDDEPARAYFRQRASHIQLISTPELLRHWAEVAKPSPYTLREALRDIKLKGRFVPRSQHPLYSWWQECSDYQGA